MANKIVINDAKKADIINGGQAYLDSLEGRLYVNAVALSGTVGPSLGDECTDGGYLAAAPVVSPYPDPAAASGTEALLTGDNVTFTFSHDAGDQTIEGVFLTDPADSDVWVFAQEAESPKFTVTAAGQVFVVQFYFHFDVMP